MSLDEAYDYAYGYVQSSGASQTPQRWLYGGEGTIVLARSPAGVAIMPVPLPESLAASLDSPYPAVRIGAVNALHEWLLGADPARAVTAMQRLRQIADNDVPAVAAAARAYLTGPERADTVRRPDQAAELSRTQRDPRPTEVSSGPQALATTLTQGSRWLTVHAVAFSPDGRLLASGLQDARTELWDSITGQHQRTLTSHTGPIHAVAFSPAGRLLASANEDKTVRLWDPVTGRHERTLTGHTRGVGGVAFSPDGRLLASASGDKTVRLWDPVTGRHQRTLTGHVGPVNAVAFSPDGRLLASASGDKTMRLWDPATDQDGRTLMGPLVGHTGWVRSVAFSPDGRLLASASEDKTVRLWDMATGQDGRTLMGPFMGHTGWVRSVAFSPDGRLLASAGDDGTVRLWC